jgi:hypothetical protein
MTGLTAILKCTLALLATVSLAAQARLYVEPFPGPLHDELVSELRKEPGLTIVNVPGGADWLLAGSGQTWVKGHMGSNPRVRYLNGEAEPLYAGYLSVELKNAQ